MAFNLRGREPRPNRIEVRLSNAELDRLNNLCTVKDESAAALIRMALNYYIDFQADINPTIKRKHNRED